MLELGLATKIWPLVENFWKAFLVSFSVTDSWSRAQRPGSHFSIAHRWRYLKCNVILRGVASVGKGVVVHGTLLEHLRNELGLGAAVSRSAAG